MIDDVAILEAIEFLGQSFRRIASDLGFQPFDQQSAFFLAGLELGFLGRHFAELQRLLRIRKQILQIDRVDGVQCVEADIVLLLFFAVAGKAIGLHHLHRLVAQYGRIHGGLSFW